MNFSIRTLHICEYTSVDAINNYFPLLDFKDQLVPIFCFQPKKLAISLFERIHPHE